jgi:hypothetical protein
MCLERTLQHLETVKDGLKLIREIGSLGSATSY